MVSIGGNCGAEQGGRGGDVVGLVVLEALLDMPNGRDVIDRARRNDGVRFVGLWLCSAVLFTKV